MNEPGKTVVIVGDVINGFRLIGPFEVPNQAITWATDNCSAYWVIAQIEKPEEFNGHDG